MAMDREWISNIDWSKVTDKHTEYALSDANKWLESGVDADKDMSKKSFVIAAAIIGYISALIPFVLISHDSLLTIPATILSAGFFIALLFLGCASQTAPFYCLGNEPKNTLYPPTMGEDYNTFLHGEIASLQERIEHNIKASTKKGKYINLAILTILLSMVASFVIYFLLRLGIFVA